jgi:hypothetical protein
VKELVEKGYLDDQVELVDIETDEGFERFTREVLSSGDGAVPSAYHEGAKCKITIQDDRLKFDCDKKEEPVSSEIEP